MVIQWIVGLKKSEASRFSQNPVTKVAQQQAMGLVALIIGTSLPEKTNSNLTAVEVKQVAQLLCYEGIPLCQIQQCHDAVHKCFSTLER